MKLHPGVFFVYDDRNPGLGLGLGVGVGVGLGLGVGLLSNIKVSK